MKRGTLIYSPGGILIVKNDSLLQLSSSLKTVTAGYDIHTKAYYDSLKARISTSRFGKTIYDLVIVEPGVLDEKEIRNKSISDFSSHNGLVINDIKIIRLDPFGTSIINPEIYSEGKSEKFLNRTHVKTKEKVISSYLLFNDGDTIEDFIISETERILRSLSFINDVRIVVVPISSTDADIVVISRDDYSAGGDFSYSNPETGEFSLFERNISGLGHNLEIGFPYDLMEQNRFGIRAEYKISNIAGSFADLSLFLRSTTKERSYGFELKRDFISAESKYAGSIALKEVFTSTATDSAVVPQPLEYAYQDYWLGRAFLLDRASLSRLIFGVRYIHNNVYEKPEIDQLSYYSLQKYRLYLGSVSFSTQKFYKTSFIYNYGRTEDIPYGGLAVFTAGREFNEFKHRNYYGTNLSWGNSPGRIGYLHLSFSAAAFLEDNKTEQGVIDISFNYFTGLITSGRWKIRSFGSYSYTKGFDRYSDEYLSLRRNELVTGFKNDSLLGQERSVIKLETVAFSPGNIYGFRFAFFSFADIALLGKEPSTSPGTTFVTALGAGVRVRNDNLIISTLQIRLAWYPNLPLYSNTRFFNVSGEPILNHKGFDAGPPSIIVYR